MVKLKHVGNGETMSVVALSYCCTMVKLKHVGNGETMSVGCFKLLLHRGQIETREMVRPCQLVALSYCCTVVKLKHGKW